MQNPIIQQSSLLSDSIPLLFNQQTGSLTIFGDSANNALSLWTVNQYIYFELDGQKKTNDPLSTFFDNRLFDLNQQNFSQLKFEGGNGKDILILRDLDLLTGLDIQTEDDLLISGNISAKDSFSSQADSLTATGSLTVANGNKGGNIDLFGNQIRLEGAKLDVSGIDSGGNIRIGGDYQGKGSVLNAQTTFVSNDSLIKANALEKGNGGRVIIWADGTTRFNGKTEAKGGSVFGDGGFVEVSGKQYLNFTGLVDTTATNGKIGDLLLDPTDLTIVVLDPFGDDSKIQLSTLEKQASNVSVAATNNITSEVSLSFVPGGAISFTAGNKFQGLNITAPGRNLSISADTIDVREVSTSNSSSGNGGNITIVSNNGRFNGSFDTSAKYGNGGNISVQSKSGSINGNFGTSAQTGNAGNILIQSISGYINTGSVYTASQTGNAGNISIQSSSGSMNLGSVIASSINGKAGNILIQSSSVGNIDFKNGINASTQTGNAGNISVQSSSGNINIFPSSNYYAINASAQTGNGGTISFQSTSGDITTPSISSTSETGNGGTVTIKTAQNISSGVIQSSSGLKTSLNGGNINIQSNNGTIAIDKVESGGFNGKGGDIFLKSKGNLTVNQNISSGSVKANAGNININSTSGAVSTGIVGSTTLSTGNAGSITIAALNQVTVKDVVADRANYFFINGELYANLPGEGISGDVSITSRNSNLTAGIVRAGNYFGSGGAVTLRAKTGITTGDIFSSSTGTDGAAVDSLITGIGNISVGAINASSYNAPTKSGGSITLKTPNGNISATGKIESISDQSRGGAILIDATGNITTQDVIATSNNANSQNIMLKTKNGKIQAGQLNSTSTNGSAGALSVSTLTSGDIETGALFANSLGDSTAKNAGNILLKTPNGKITANGWLQSYAAGGNTGTVTVDATGDIKTDLISNVASNGTAGNVVVKSTAGAVQTGAVETFTFGGGNAGAISLQANKDIISTGSIAAGTPSNKNGAKIELTSTTGKIDTNGQDIDAISWYGVGGAITLSADKDINVGAVHNEDDKATAGIKDINLTSTNGNITAKWIRSDSLNGVGGNISMDAKNLIKVTGSVIIDEIDYSIYAGGFTASNSIKIKHGGGSSRNPFIVSALSGIGVTMPFTNGTFANIASASSGIFSVENPLAYPSTHVRGDILITTDYTGSSPEAYVPVGNIIGYESLYEDDQPLINSTITPTLIASSGTAPLSTVPVTRVVIPQAWNPNQPIPFYIGNTAHRDIAQYYRSNHPPSDDQRIFTNSTPVKTILTRLNTPIPVSLKDIDLDKRPDILDSVRNYIYEIKPRGQEALAVKISKNFIKIFKKANITLNLGSVDEPGTSGLLPFPGGILTFAPPAPGAIVYRSYRRTRQTEVEESKVSRANILSAIGRQQDGFPDDIFVPTPNPTSQDPDPVFVFPDFKPEYLAPILFKILEFIWNGAPSRN